MTAFLVHFYLRNLNKMDKLLHVMHEIILIIIIRKIKYKIKSSRQKVIIFRYVSIYCLQTSFIHPWK